MKLPRLEYNGQTTEELLACKDSHHLASLLFAFEWGIQAKARLSNENDLTVEERAVLALMALEREVNNGGYHQFFLNSSRRFVSIVVDSLTRIGCERTAAITSKAIEVAKVGNLTTNEIEDVICRPDPERDLILRECDIDYYKTAEVKEKIFPFIETNQSQIQLIPGTQPPVARKSNTK